MATIAERFRGISGNQDERIIRYVIEDAKSDQDALNIAEAAAPITYDLMPRQNIRVVERAKYAFADRSYGGPGEDIEEQNPTIADGLYHVEAVYTRRRGTQPVEETNKKPTPADADANHDTFSFEQTLESIRIRESGVPDKYTPGGMGAANPTDALKFTGINEQANGTIEGVDIRSPIGTFAYDYFPDKSAVNQAYQDLVTGLVGSVNNATFFNKAAGTVLFTGASGRKRNQTDWEFNFRFEYRPNQAGVTIGEGSNQITYSRLGHQYVWVYYDEIPDTNAAGETRTIQVPRQVNVHTIYPTADLNAIFP